MTRPLPAAGVWLLAVGQTLSYAAIFYIFAALVLSLETGLGWDKRVLALGPMVALGVSAVLAPLVGKAVDRGYGRMMLALGSIWGALVLAALSQVTTPMGWVLGWTALGLAQALCLYEVCFAWLIRRYGPGARAQIVRVTLVAGLASTLAFPAGAALGAAFGWRGAMLVGAGIMLLLVLPLNVLGCHLVRRETDGVVEVEPPGARPMHVLRRPAFWGLGTLFMLVGLNHWMLISFLVPLLVERGVGHGVAVLAASCVGPAQTLGRLVLMRYEARVTTVAVLRWILGGMLAAVGVMAMAGASGAFALGFAAIQGASMGVMTILRPVLVADMLGRSGFGQISGMLSIPSLGASALAPLFAAALFEGFGPWGVIVCVMAVSVVAFGLGWALGRVRT